MAHVFISHAHSDAELARRMVALLKDALPLGIDDFFVSSQAGSGVAPGARIRDEILAQLSTAPALIVVLTPRSAGSPWVWLEAGHRLGRPDKMNPVFAVPSARFVSLLQFLGDQRCIVLDKDDDLHELVNTVGEKLGKPPRRVLDYKPSLDELVREARAAYSPYGERKAVALSWLTKHWASLVFALLGAVAIAAGRWQLAQMRGTANVTLNDEAVRTAARYLILKGTVVSGNNPVRNATVMASRDKQVKDAAACQRPECTSDETTVEGEFLIDLTRILVQNGDDIVLSVVAPGFDFYSQHINVDVRAMDAGEAPHKIKLASGAVLPSDPEPRQP
jgi:TIR domain